MKKHLEYTPSTAHKKSFNIESTSKLQYSPQLLTPSHRRKCTNLTSKISSLRQTFDQLISTVSDKRSLQHNAVQRVYDVNSQLADQLSHTQPTVRDLSVHSIRQDKQFGEVSTHIEHPRSGQSLYVSINQGQNIRLKQSLNEQIRDTNSLMIRLKSLQNQHEYLKEHLDYKHKSAARFEIEENKRLKEQLNQLNRQQSVGFNAVNLWEEFCELKKENEMLRRETIGMLKRDQGKQKYSNQYKVDVTYAY